MSLTWTEGVFALRLDFGCLRRRDEDEDDDQRRYQAAPRPAAVKKKLVAAKTAKGPRPLPPPFPLPPVKRDERTEEELLDALPPPPVPSPPRSTSSPSVIVDSSIGDEAPLTQLEMRASPPRGLVRSPPLTAVPRPPARSSTSNMRSRSPEETMDEDADPPTDLRAQRRNVRKALRGTAR